MFSSDSRPLRSPLRELMALARPLVRLRAVVPERDRPEPDPGGISEQLERELVARELRRWGSCETRYPSML
jgi:hypothetical protein